MPSKNEDTDTRPAAQPMAPERIALLEQGLAKADRLDEVLEAIPADDRPQAMTLILLGIAVLARELLDDRDHLEAELARERRMGIEAAERVEMACDMLGDEHGDIVLLAEAKAAEAQRLRSRCPVTAEDVEARDPLADEEADTLAPMWVAFISRIDGAYERSSYEWRHRHSGPHSSPAYTLMQGNSYAALADSVTWVAEHLKRPAFDILDEMAKGAGESEECEHQWANTRANGRICRKCKLIQTHGVDYELVAKELAR